MKKLNFILILSLVLILSGCSSDDDKGDENNQRNGTLIFGWFADSTCSGACSTIYKIDTKNIYRDVNFNYPENTFFEGDFQLMSTANFQDFESLITELPNEIFDEPNGYLDCIDCTNEKGGFYLEYQDDDGFHKSWRFRNVKYPDYIESYRSLLLDKLAELNSL
ncbi:MULTISPECIES: lipoprotein [unclassified Tenacibaculum]|uniref:lipoprotein n=1 Tax=unclassified Tenacibaculum TaxID=2635139 RepID=UPI001F22F4FF|nr:MULTISPECIES: lipoprotein [unclassified Tenacibaculum]MCF2875835.1 lipoprotein [Tenacibaculum sp. Cn5-1]MCF2935910.1 lipoprotein [Tenacibaculum sp. Cn5-34]MCG7512471.1 lipoprotein [Tenacibaculum sp. Cn5-46]